MKNNVPRYSQPQESYRQDLLCQGITPTFLGSFSDSDAQKYQHLWMGVNQITWVIRIWEICPRVADFHMFLEKKVYVLLQMTES